MTNKLKKKAYVRCRGGSPLKEGIDRSSLPSDCNAIKELYPEGIDQKMMGPTIGRVKGEFERVDGKLLSECVRSIIK